MAWVFWRNPTGEQRHWNFDTYAETTIEVLDVAREVTGSPDVNIIGACLGGITAAIVQAHVAAGFTDHITPWKTAYRTTQMVSGPAQFVTCSSGHIQTVVADPKHRGLGYFLNAETPSDPEQWLAGAERHEGSWWGHYAAWLAERSGEQVTAPQLRGSVRYLPIEPAPGSYIHQ